MDGELRTYGSATELTGSTATVILIKHGDLLCANLGNLRFFYTSVSMKYLFSVQDYILIISIIALNIGDSRAIAQVNGSVKSLSQDHNTSNPKERERVYSMGGTIKDNR